MSGKPLSQGTYMPNMKALSERVQNLWPMLKLSNKQTNQQTDRAQTICACYRYPGHKKVDCLHETLKTMKSEKRKWNGGMEEPETWGWPFLILQSDTDLQTFAINVSHYCSTFVLVNLFISKRFVTFHITLSLHAVRDVNKHVDSKHFVFFSKFS